MGSPGPGIRAATEADAGAIRALVREARLNPRDLDWRRFLVADDDGVVVACAQVRVHGGGTRELASVAVAPARRGEGIGRRITEATIAHERVRPLFLYTEGSTIGYWVRFGFREVPAAEVPGDLRGPLLVGRIAVAALGTLRGRRLRLALMRRDER